MIRLTRSASGWHWPLVWVATVGMAVVAVLLSMHASAQRQLHAEAEHVAQRFARLVGAGTTDLDALLAGAPTAQALHDLRAMRRVGDVVRFELFRPDGVRLLASDDLDKPDPELLRTARLAASGPQPERKGVFARIARGDASHITLKAGTGQPDQPAVVSEAYVPVHADAAVVAVLRVQVDQTARQAGVQAALLRNGLTVALALAAVAVVGLWHLHARRRTQRQAEERVRYLARHDTLSGALNRSSFGDALAHAVQRHRQGGGGFAVLCLDLDHFKEVNDTLGHAAGDEVLRQATARLQGLVRPGDIVARLGGDEFAVLQQGVNGPDAVRMVAHRIIDALSRPYSVAGAASARCGVSVGAALFGPEAPDVQQLMHQADLALYRAKTSGRGGFSFYDVALDRELQARRELVRDLRLALERQQLHLHFQAQVAADARTVTGYEALLRWDHPVHGQVTPATFIPLAEDHGFIDALGSWVLRRACTQAAHWPAPLSVSVNLSAAQFRGSRLVEDVTRALSQSGLAPSRLTLEITESLLMHDAPRVMERLQALAALGVRFAMDDFGTGFSSLAYLWRFPFDKLKIDPVFTRALPDDPKVNLIVRSLVKLAHALEIRVNAEGVETATQLRLLQKHGCDEFQGYLMGRPAPAHHLSHDDALTETPARPRPSDATLADLPTMPAPWAESEG